MRQPRGGARGTGWSRARRAASALVAGTALAMAVCVTQGVARAEPDSSPGPGPTSQPTASPAAQATPSSSAEPSPDPEPAETSRPSPTADPAPAESTSSREDAPSTPAATTPSRPKRAAAFDVAGSLSNNDPVALAGDLITVFGSLTATGDPPATTDLGYTVTLPAGASIDGDPSPACTTAADRRSLHCVTDVGAQLGIPIRLESTLAAGTRLTITLEVDPIAGDGDPTNDTATATVLIITRSDLQLTWEFADVDVRPDADVTTTLTVTNRGPWPRRVRVYVAYLPPEGLDESVTVVSFPRDVCSPDIYDFTCSVGSLDDPPATLAPGASARLSFTWRFDASAAGRVYPITAKLTGHEQQESDTANDQDTVNIHILTASTPSASPSPAPTSETTRTDPAGPDGSDDQDPPAEAVLAETGGTDLWPLLGGAAAVCLGVALLSRRRRGRHEATGHLRRT